jgi:hypothetical protein
MPWKNGGGSTLELAVEPPGANLETGFLWRLSSAEVAESGPFSSFPGLERWLFLLEGDGFLLDFGSRGRMDLREPCRPVRFLGDWPATATLAGGPSTDLNLMVDPNRIRASVEVVRLERNRVFPLAAGSASVPSLDLHLGWHHLLRLEEGGGSTLELAPGLVPAQVVKMDLQPL